MEAENEIDLFDDYESLPQDVQDVLETFGEVEGYEGCRALIDALEPLGYTCEYGLDACPYNLRKLILFEGKEYIHADKFIDGGVCISKNGKTITRLDGCLGRENWIPLILK